MKRRSVGVFISITCLLGAAAIWRYGRSADPPPRPAQEARGSRPESAHGQARTARGLLRMNELLEEARVKASPRATPSVEPEGELEATVREVLPGVPAMAEFHVLREKALRTREERAKYSSMVADPKMIARAEVALLKGPAGGELSQAEEVERILQVRYLTSALADPNNPNHAAAVAAATAVILADVPTGVTPEVRGSLLGDKVELYQHLLLTDPERAAALLDEARGSRIESILLLARNMNEPRNQTTSN